MVKDICIVTQTLLVNKKGTCFLERNELDPFHLRLRFLSIASKKAWFAWLLCYLNLTLTSLADAKFN